MNVITCMAIIITCILYYMHAYIVILHACYNMHGYNYSYMHAYNCYMHDYIVPACCIITAITKSLSID